MPLVEIDEAELASLQGNSRLLATAMANPKAREQVLRGIKLAKPDLSIPEIDAKDPVMEELTKFGKTMQEMRDEIAANKQAATDEKRLAALTAQWNEGRARAQKQGYVGESLEALEKFMEEKGVAEHDIAIPAFERMHPPATPVNNTSGKFDFFARQGDENEKLSKKLWENDPSYLDDAIGQTLRDIRAA